MESNNERVVKLTEIIQEYNDKVSDNRKIDINLAINWIPQKPHIGLILAIWQKQPPWKEPGDLDPRSIPKKLTFGEPYDILKGWCPGGITDKDKEEENEYDLDECFIALAFRYIADLRMLLYMSLPLPYADGENIDFGYSKEIFKRNIERFNEFWIKLKIAKEPISCYEDFWPHIFTMSDLDVIYVLMECENNSIVGTAALVRLLYYKQKCSYNYIQNDY